MVSWHLPLNGLEFEHDLRDGEGQGILTSCVVHGVAKSWTQVND